MLGFQVQDWTSEDRSRREVVQRRPFVGSTAELVVHLVTGLRVKGLVVTMDNFFTSAKLFRRLHAAGMDAVGTVKLRSDIPMELLWPKAKRGRQVGAARFFRSADRVLLLQAWQDNSAVHVLSTCHSGVSGLPETLNADPACPKVKRMRRAGGGWDRHLVACPPAVAFYQKTMRGVDIADAVCALYAVILCA